jgi:hypothetical protein
MDFEQAHPLACSAFSLLAFLVLSGSVMWPFRLEATRGSIPFHFDRSDFAIGIRYDDSAKSFPWSI